MKIDSVSSSNSPCRKPNFGMLHVTVSKANMSKQIIGVTNDYIRDYHPEIRTKARFIFDELKRELNLDKNDKIYNFDDLANKVNVFVLAAGKGTRFLPVCDILEKKTGEKNNKISLPIKVKGENFRLFNIPLILGAAFAQEKKPINIIQCEEPKGSFHDVYEYYKQNPYKDFVILSGDCIYGDGADLKSFMKLIITCVNNPNRHVCDLCGIMSPEQAANRAAVATIKGTRRGDGTYALEMLKEKPSLFYARANVFAPNKVYASAGGYYCSVEALTKIMERLKDDPSYIMKDPTEVHDYAKLKDKVIENSREFFNKSSQEVNAVYPLEFSDVGTPDVFMNLLMEIKNQNIKYIQNLPKHKQVDLISALNQRLTTQSDGSIIFNINGAHNNSLDPSLGEEVKNTNPKIILIA